MADHCSSAQNSAAKTSRPLDLLLCLCAAVFLGGNAAEAQNMHTIFAVCRSDVQKGDATPDVCPLFVEELATSHPELSISDAPVPEDWQGDIAELVVLRASAWRLEARLDWHRSGQVTTGTALATHSMDRELGAPQIARFLSALINQTPRFQSPN